MLSLNITGHSLGRALGAFLAAIIYQRFGFLFVALLAVAFNIAGMLALVTMQRKTTQRINHETTRTN
jgi:predicted MFS family arabinose efflux permease